MAHFPPEVADAGLAAFLAQPGPAFAELDVLTLRRQIAQRVRARSPGPDMDDVTDFDMDGLRARLYRPAPGPVPLIVYLHGGGWTIGSIESHDRLCRRLAHSTGAAVLAVDYRLAPEHPWPASVEDAVTTLRGVARQPPELGAVTGEVVVAGDSAGGTLAALACLRLRDDHPEALPALQVLLCGNTDLTGAHPSMREKAHGWGLDVDAIRFFNRQWVPDETRWADPGVSPFHATDLAGLPDAVVVTAEHDPLRDEGEAYAGRLRAAGVAVELRREPGLIHNFMLLDEVSPACATAADRVAADIRNRLGRPPRGRH
jgi:acetyl esterase